MRRFVSLVFFAALAGCSSNDTTTPVPDAGGGGGGGSDGPAEWNRAVTPPADADAQASRDACTYKAGSLPAETQGKSHPSGADIPVDHIIVLMQENRSFDSYFQKLPEYGQPDVEVAPPTYTNPDANGMPVAPHHDTEYCLADTNHDWDGSHQEYDDGKMDGFFKANDNWSEPPAHPLPDSTSGTRALSYYDQTDIPFYYWLANEYAIADHYHCSLLGPTWPNRMYLYAATSRGATTNSLADFAVQKGACKTDADCGGAAGACVAETGPGGDKGSSCKGSCTKDSDCDTGAQPGACDVAGGGACKPVEKTIWDYMERRKLDWKVYGDGTAGFAITLNAYLRFNSAHKKTIADFVADAQAGTLPAVAFIDPHLGAEKYNQDDEHPPANPQPGQAFVAKIVDALQKSPEWSKSALFLTYDEHGGFYDHVAPPKACHPGDEKAVIVAPENEPGDFDRYGVRVPMIVVSPFAKKHYVGHHVYDHTSIVRFIEARFVIAALTNRDANAEAPWDMFDFDTAPHATAPAFDMPTIDPAKDAACGAVWNK